MVKQTAFQPASATPLPARKQMPSSIKQGKVDHDLQQHKGSAACHGWCDCGCQHTAQSMHNILAALDPVAAGYDACAHGKDPYSITES